MKEVVNMSKKEDVLNAAKFRRAIKEFDETRKISDSDFDYILEIGRLSPSSFGLEPWQFVVIQNKELRGKLAGPSWGVRRQLPGASHYLVILARKAAELQVGSDYMKHMFYEIDGYDDERVKQRYETISNFQDNEFDLTDERKMFDWACKQSYIALANMMSAAAHIGIDSCPIEGFGREAVEEILAEAGIIDREVFGVAVMAVFGYRKSENEYPKARRPREEVIKWIK